MRTNANTIIISRQGFDTLTLGFDNEPNLSEVLEKAGWTLSANESVFVNGEKAEASSIFEDGDTLQVVGKKEGGLK